jgi:hypothetical protein
MSGREIWTIGKIAPLITFEMMMRRFFDAQSSKPVTVLVRLDIFSSALPS